MFSFLSSKKSKWHKYINPQVGETILLNSLSWSTMKKAFMLSAISLSTSTNVNLTYKYVYLSSGEIQYPQISDSVNSFIVSSTDIDSKGILNVTIEKNVVEGLLLRLEMELLVHGFIKKKTQKQVHNVLL